MTTLAELGEIAKSYVKVPHPGDPTDIKEFYKPISEVIGYKQGKKLTSQQRQAIKRQRQFIASQRKARLNPPATTPFRQAYGGVISEIEQRNKEIARVQGLRGATGRTHDIQFAPGLHAQHGQSGSTSTLGGKSRRRSFMLIDPHMMHPKLVQNLPDLIGHEVQHALPKRSSWRLAAQIMTNPAKHGREEARADAVIHRGNPFGIPPVAQGKSGAGARLKTGTKLDLKAYHALRNKLQPGQEGRPMGRRAARQTVRHINTLAEDLNR